MTDISDELMREWYGKNGKLAKSGFRDLERFDEHWEPRDALLASPASPDQYKTDVEIEQNTDQYEYFYRHRAKARELEGTERCIREPEHQEHWLIALLRGEGESLQDIALFLGYGLSTFRRMLTKLEQKWEVRK